MSDAEKALAEFNHYLDSHGARLHPDEESFCEGYERGHAAASASTARLVRAAVEATREMAATIVDNEHEHFHQLRDDRLRTDNLRAASIHTAQADAIGLVSVRVRALDIDAIVARVMQSQ